MSTPFALATLAGPDGQSFVAIRVAGEFYRLNGESAASVDALLIDWAQAFDRLQHLAETVSGPALGMAAHRYLPPVRRPGKILNSAANYREHVAEMAAYNIAAGADPAKRFAGDKSKARPYLFLKAPSALNGAFDPIILPETGTQIDWEAELAVVIGTPARNVTAARALDHVAGYMTSNDVTCRDLLWREDRPNFKTDWLSSKSHDGFAPMGPVFVPAAFIPDPNALNISLKVNGAVKQSGNTGEMIFSAEEQIEFASRMMTLHPGDIFCTGTVGGVGQATGEFLKAGDVVETEIEGIGRMENRVVAAL